MLVKHFGLALLGATLVGSTALAQTNPPASSSSNPPAAMSTTASPSGGNFLTEEKAGQWRASKLEGLDVYNSANEKIGDIRELLVTENGQLEAIVIGVGGFLGMGEHDVAVPYKDIKFVMEPRAMSTAATNATNPPGAPGSAMTPAGPATTGTVASTDTSRRTYPDHALLDMNKDQLKAAPEFKYSR
jgi:sporulation protein YlmC with PRC-barrel domain